MQYNTSYEFTALIFLICIAVHFYTKKSYPSPLNSIFGLYLACGMLDIALDLIGAGMLAKPWGVPLWLNYAVNISYYLMQMLMPYLLFMYVLILTERLAAMGLARRLLTAIGLIIMAGFIVTTPFTRFIFYFDHNRVYCYGEFSYLAYVCSTGYVIATDVVLIRDRRKLTRRQFATILSFTLISAMGMVIQFFNNKLLVTGVAMAVCITLLYLTLQNSKHMTDELTGMLDRNSFNLHLREQMLMRSSRSFVVVASIDGLRALDLALGMRVSNELMRRLSSRVVALSGQNPSFRLQDDQFAIVCTDTEAAGNIASRVAREFNQKQKLDDIDIVTSGRVAYMQTPCQNYSLTDVLHIIDHMSAAVRKPNGLELRVDDGVIARIKREDDLITAMRESVESAEKTGFDVYLQPMYSPKLGRFVAAEALLRFTHPVLGAISPEEFIPLAERNGLMIDLGEFVLRRVCEYERDYRLSEMFDVVSINASEAELLRENGADRTLSILDEFGIDRSMMCFEVTETIATDSYAGIRRNMDALHDGGVSFSLDDFGCGYANFDSIMALPFAAVKLDKSMLDAASGSGRAQVVLKSMINMIQDIDMAVVVEGAENCEQAALLDSLGVDLVQGYYYAHAMPIVQCVEFLKCKRANTVRPCINSDFPN